MAKPYSASYYFRPHTWPFWIMHIACVGAFFVEFSWWYVALALVGYAARMFGVTGGYHRYFSHRTYSTSRVFQFMIAFLAMCSAQKGVIWWASHHRHHHAHSDQEGDVHSPQDGFWWSHVGWILSNDHEQTEERYVRDLMRFPELVWLDKYFLVPPTIWGIGMFLLAGLPGLIWGLCISTVMLWHGTFTINSLSHVWGKVRYATTDTSRNNFWLAIITLGEGWHNNHHRFQSSARNGFFWWELDITYYTLKFFSLFGLVWDLRPVPAHLLDSHNDSWVKNQQEYTMFSRKNGAVKTATKTKEFAEEVM